MSTSDTESVFSGIDGTWTIYDGSGNSLEFDFVQADIEWTEEGAPYTEAKVRNKHKTTPVLRKTGDGNVTGSGSCLVKSFRGTTSATPYEVLTLTGSAASWTTTAVGDKKALRGMLRINNPSGADQTATFAFCVFMNTKVAPSGSEGLYQLSYEFTDHENNPAWA